MEYLAHAIFLGCAFLVLHGWGRLFLRVFKIESSASISTLCAGLGTLVFSGGWLNLMGGVNALSLLVLLAAGFVFGLFSCFTHARTNGFHIGLPTQSAAPFAVLAIIISASFFFTVDTQCPPSVFNLHDDFRKYFVFVVRILATGTVFGDPLSAMGAETLGGHAFLQAFPAAFFPLKYINAVDALFGKILCAFIIVSASWRSAKTLWAGVGGLAVLLMIEPQYVNVSTLYLGGAFTMASILLFAHNQDETNTCAPPPPPAVVGLFIAALAAMKPSLLLFPCLFLLFLPIFRRDSVQSTLTWLGKVILSAAFFILPWFALHAPHYFSFTDVEAVLTSLPPGAPENLNIFSTTPLFYGASMLAYTALVLGVALFAFCSFASLKTRNRDTTVNANALLAGAASILTTYVFHLLVLAPVLHGLDTAVRLFAPVAIGVAPLLFVLSSRKVLLDPDSGAFSRRLMLSFNVAVLVAICVLFYPSFEQRLNQAITQRNILAFQKTSEAPGWELFCAQALSPSGKARVLQFQAHIPAGAPFFAWINNQFLFDFNRNDIAAMEESSMGAHWSRAPPVKYYIWEYAWFGDKYKQQYAPLLRSPGRRYRLILHRSFQLVDHLETLSAKGEILYDDGKVRIFKIQETPTT